MDIHLDSFVIQNRYTPKADKISTYEAAPLHLVIRFSDTMFEVGDVISLHNQIVDEHGAVWFGKLGGTLSLSHIEWLNKQIAQKIPTYIYLVKGNRKKSAPHKAGIVAVSRDFPKKEKVLIPPYYVEKIHECLGQDRIYRTGGNGRLEKSKSDQFN